MVQPGSPSWSSVAIAPPVRPAGLWMGFGAAGALLYVAVVWLGVGGPAGQAAALLLPLGVLCWNLGLRGASAVVAIVAPLSVWLGEALAIGRLEWVLPCHAVAAVTCLGLARLRDVSVAAGEAREGALRVRVRLQRRRAQADALLRALPDLVFRVRGGGSLQGIAGLSGGPVASAELSALLPAPATKRIAEAAARVGRTGHPEALLCESASHDQPRDFEVRLVHVDGDAFGILRDVTKRRRLERELIAARETALDAGRLKTKFLANMSHEIRTPMNGVIGMTNLLRETPLTREQGEYVEIIHKSGDALLEIIDEILDFAKIEAGKMELDELEFDPRACAYESVEAVAGQAFAKDLELGTIVHDGVPALSVGDPTRLRQVLAILLSNAVRYTERGRVAVEVRADPVANERQMLRFCVRDTGPGLSPSLREEVFQPIIREADAEQGAPHVTGLGLAISRQLVELMGGEIRVESGDGTAFWFSVALGVVADAEPEGVSERLPLHARRVLLVQHTPGRRLMMEVLRSLGVEAQVASRDGTLDRLLSAEREGRAFEAVIFDLPRDPEGVMVTAREVRAEPSLAGLPLLALDEPEANSSVAREDLRRLVGRLLHWPVRRDEVLGALRAALARAADDQADGTSPLMEHCRSEPPLPGVRVLVVNPASVDQRLLVRSLELLGCMGEPASDIDSALEVFPIGAFDAVLLDCALADDGAFGALPSLRALFADVPVIATAGRDEPRLRERCLQAGFSDLVQRPFALADLRASLESRLRPSTHPQAPMGAPPAELDVPAGDALDGEVLQKLEALGDGDTSFLREIIDLFLDQTPRNLAAIEAALSVGDPDAVAKTAHSMKSGASYLGAMRMSDLCRLVERQARGEEPGEGLLRAVESLHAEFERVQRALSVELERIGS